MTRKRIVAIVLAIALTVGVGVAGGAIVRSMDSPSVDKLTVHGQWTIVVHNKRGKVVARRHFENALVPGGAGLLSQLLSRQISAGSWGVNIGFGAIVDATNSASDSPPFYKNLVVSATPTSNVTINNVDTYLGSCSGAPGSCTSNPAGTQFTHKTLDGLNGDPAAVNVAAGQQVAVTVKLSFS